ncbi:MAG: Cell wall-associated hydrolase, partial [Bacteroidetes bacterium]|nr:Cell wall-associated hydrolase [Bacteroidota bacterium]
MKKIFFTLLALTFSSSSPTLSFQEKPNEILQDAFRRVKEKFAPDKRTAVFDISWERNGSSLVVKGEADNLSAKAELVRAFQESSSITVVDSIRLLPDPSLGDKTFGIVSLSVGNVRSK